MNIAVLLGDGIGPEVIAQAVRVLKALAGHGVHLEIAEAPIGATAYERNGDPLPPATFEVARWADAILFGSAGGFEHEALPRGKRPGDAVLCPRKTLTLYANFRPAVMLPELIGASTLSSSGS